LASLFMQRKRKANRTPPIRSSACLAALALAAGLAAPIAARAAAPTQAVLNFHATPDHAGNYVTPALTWARAPDIRPDANFHPTIPDHIYAQPLYWRDGSGRAFLFVATEDDNVYALDATTGATVWKTSLGKAAPVSAMSCGDIDPRGVTGTPVIDPATQSIYLDAVVDSSPSGAPQQEIFALSLKDGSIRPGWPANVAKALAARPGPRFDPKTENQRGALAVLGDTVYVPYGSTWDCGNYRGWVVGVKLRDPKTVTDWHVAGYGAGSWAPGGIASDGKSLFVSTGDGHNPNGTLYSGTIWQDSEAVIRLAPGPSFSGEKKDFFSPTYWRDLDAHDADISGAGPVLFNLDGHEMEIQLSKDTHAYLLNAENLGGFGGSLVDKPVSSRGIITTPTVYTQGDVAMVAFQGPGLGCPPMKGRPELTMLRVRAGKSPSIDTAWCAPLSGDLPARQLGAAMVTTTDGHNNPIVWILGAEDDNRLYGFRGDNGQRLFVSGALPGVHRFQSLIAVGHRLYVAADGNVFAFDF
jgi:PQQ enzyme repeat